MIRRINRIKNVGRFVGLRTEGGGQHDFVRKNVVYAPNGSGKSTLCDLFRSLGTGRADYLAGRKRLAATDPIEVEVLLGGTPATTASITPAGWQTTPTTRLLPILIYDDRFVAEHVLVGHGIAVDQRRNLYGLVLGERAQGMKRAVETAEDALSTATTALNAARQNIQTVVPAGFSLESFRSLPADPDIERKIVEAQASLETSRRLGRSRAAIQQRRLLEAFTLPSVPDALAACLATTLAEMALQAEVRIRQHLEQHTHGLGLDWIAAGHRAQVGTDCPHCGQDMATLSLLASFRAFFSGELQAQETRLKDLLRQAGTAFGPAAQERLSRALEGITAERDWWRGIAGVELQIPDSPAPAETQAVLDATFRAMISCLERKQAAPSEACVLTTGESQALENWQILRGRFAAVLGSLGAVNEQIAQQKHAAAAIDLTPLERRVAELDAQHRRHSREAVDAFRAYDEALASKSVREREKVTANQSLRRESAEVLAAYGDRINALLTQFGCNFSVASDGVNFAGGPPACQLAIEILGVKISAAHDDGKNPRIPSLTNTLSAGDRSALGFAFFIAVTEANPQLADAIVIVDDPFHSQDRSRRSRTVEAIARIGGLAKQTVVFSHELDFALTMAGYFGAGARTFSITPAGDQSIVKGDNLPQLSRLSFEKDYERLTDYLENPERYADRRQDVARAIRQTLEGYLRCKFPRDWRDDDWLGDMIGKLRDAAPNTRLHMAQHLVADLTNVNEWGKHHYHANTAGPIDDIELSSYVRDTIKIVSR